MTLHLSYFVGHFREKDGKGLYWNLSSLTQQTNGTPQEFVFRALDLRQKVGFASQRDGSMLAIQPVTGLTSLCSSTLLGQGFEM